MILTLSQVCSLESSFEKDIEDYAAAQCRAVEIWLTKLETYLEDHSVNDVRQLLERHDVRAPVASYQGGLLTSQGDRRKETWELFARRLELCSQVGIETLVVAADIGLPLTQTDVERARVSLEQAAREAGRRGLRIALEFQARASFCNNLQTAVTLVEDVASPHLGICLDVFHYYVGASKSEDLKHLTRENLYHVQLSDLAGTPREFAVDADRILPGDGDFFFDPILQRLDAIHYAGPISIELLNPQIWRVPSLQFGEIAMTALRKLLGQASGK